MDAIGSIRMGDWVGWREVNGTELARPEFARLPIVIIIGLSSLALLRSSMRSYAPLPIVSGRSAESSPHSESRRNHDQQSRRLRGPADTVAAPRHGGGRTSSALIMSPPRLVEAGTGGRSAFPHAPGVEGERVGLRGQLLWRLPGTPHRARARCACCEHSRPAGRARLEGGGSS